MVSRLGIRSLPSSGSRYVFDVTIPDFWTTRAFVIYEEIGKEIDLRIEGVGDGTFWVTDSAGEVLVDNSLESGALTVGSYGPHFLMVSIASGDSGQFELTSNVPLYPLEDPDDGRGIDVGETLAGYMDSPADYDYFSIDLRRGQTILVEAHSLLLDLELWIDFPGSSPEQLVYDNDSGRGTFGDSPSIVYRAPTTGTHTIAIADYYGTGGGGYLISVQEAPEDARAVGNPAGPRHGDERIRRYACL